MGIAYKLNQIIAQIELLVCLGHRLRVSLEINSSPVQNNFSLTLVSEENKIITVNTNNQWTDRLDPDQHVLEMLFFRPGLSN